MKKKRKNLLDKINAVAAFVWFISGSSAIDSLHWIPFVVFAICTLWIFLFLNDGTKHRGGECHAVDR